MENYLRTHKESLRMIGKLCECGHLDTREACVLACRVGTSESNFGGSFVKCVKVETCSMYVCVCARAHA